MADLLECLIQIKGLADTPRRFALRAGEAAARSQVSTGTAVPVREVACRLLVAERWFRGSLVLMLSRDRPAIPGLAALDAAVAPMAQGVDCAAEFAAERAETVRLLEACSADQLNRVGIEPARGPITVADLVAAMLAHDTDRLGDLVQG